MRRIFQRAVEPERKEQQAGASGKYRVITLLSHVMKVLERILDGRIRKKVII